MDGPGGSVLIDTGFPSAARKILAGVRALGKRPEDIRHILLTHAHPDHIGGAAALKRATGAEACVHALDASIVETGGPLHPMGTAPGLRNLVFRTLVSGWVKRVEGTVVDHRLEDGQPVPFDDDLRAFHVPGHCAGQLAFLWRRAGGVLFAADACVNMRGMQIPAAVEDYAMAKRDVEMLVDLRFEVACFGHGPPIVGGADAVFRNGGCQERWMRMPPRFATWERRSRVTPQITRVGPELLAPSIGSASTVDRSTRAMCRRHRTSRFRGTWRYVPSAGP